MEMIHMIAALPEFEGVHPNMIENFWNQVGCQRKDGNDHYVFFTRKDNSPIHKISNAGHGLAPFCTNYHSRPIEREVIRTVFDNVQIYCPIWQKNRSEYKDFDTRYEEAQLITKPDAFHADGIDPNTKCILTMSKKQKQRLKCGNSLTGRGTVCGGDLEFTIPSHNGIHFTSMKCLKCTKPNTLYCKICDQDFALTTKHWHPESFNELLKTTPILCNECIKADTDDRHGSLLQFKKKGVTAENAKNEDILICENKTCRKEMQKKGFFHGNARKCDGFMFIWCNAGKHPVKEPLKDGALVENYFYTQHHKVCARRFSKSGKGKGFWNFHKNEVRKVDRARLSKSIDNSDSSSNDEKSGKKKSKKSSKAPRKPEPGDSSSDEDEAHNATQRKKKSKKSSKAPRKPEPDDSSSDEDEAHNATQRKKRKKKSSKAPRKPEPGDSSSDKDEAHNATHRKKRKKRKKKSSKAPRKPEPGDSSSDKDEAHNATQRKKRKKKSSKAPRKPEPGDSSSDKDEAHNATQRKKRKKNPKNSGKKEERKENKRWEYNCQLPSDASTQGSI
ncbi:predicted protein [Chaetoceros tenuissimus]|uniref:Uncharacterized protein n=1 Tax=Chaetoceros tenuissimus TaxID=426638 RepID=A0AAD3DBT2_9STRA|nr:predicted protein [Chaetoceros tenuissimus]